MNPVPLARGLIDTSLLVLYRNADPDAVRLMDSLRQHGLPDVSQYSVLVLLAQCQDAWDRSYAGVLGKLLTVHKLTAATMRRAQQILEATPLPGAIAVEDAVVAATAIEHKLPLYTLDPARFAAVPGLTALKPY